MARRLIILVLVLAVTALTAGCAKTRTVDASSGAPQQVDPAMDLVAKSRPPIFDLPLPIGFRLDEKKSRNFSAAGARYVDHVYKGGSDKFTVGRFYKRHMPIHRWVLVTDMFVQGDIMLDFEKEIERCRVIVTKGSMFNPVRIKVQLWTSGRIETPKEKAK
ncbi:MAG: hypothetical protein SVT52_04835 [Planctomycetota bacterium]|nr:hypothetical protein [Planctomycetota bacterium]